MTVPHADAAGSSSIASRLKRARLERGLSIERLAHEAQVGAGTVSQYERGIGNPTLGTLRRLASVLDLSLPQLAGSSLSESGSDGQGAGLSRAGFIGLVRADARRTLSLPGPGPEYEILSPDLDGSILLMHSVFRVGFDSFGEPFSHPGEEAVVIVSGVAEARIGDELVVLRAGDSVTFDASLDHAWRTVGDEDAHFYSALTPPAHT